MLWAIGRCICKPKKVSEDGSITEELLEGDALVEYKIQHNSVIGPSIGTFIQICLYQGVIFVELNYFLYDFLPVLGDSKDFGVAYQFDKHDLAIIFDCSIFFLSLIQIFIGDVFWAFTR